MAKATDSADESSNPETDFSDKEDPREVNQALKGSGKRLQSRSPAKKRKGKQARPTSLDFRKALFSGLPKSKSAPKKPVPNSNRRGHCATCGAHVENLVLHFMQRHQSDGDRADAEALGLKQCACGWFGKSLKRHWKTCSLPIEEQREAPRAKVAQREANSEWDLLFETLAADDATASQIEEAFELLARIPGFSRIWAPAEARVLRRKIEALCETYMNKERPVDLFRIMAIQKVGCHPMFTRNRLGALIKRLRSYPKLKTSPCLDELQERDVSRPPTLKKQVHRKLQQGKVGAAGRLLEDGFGLAPINDSTLKKLAALHPKEPLPDWPLPKKPVFDLCEDDLTKALLRTSRETSGGPSGLDGNTIFLMRRSQVFAKFLLFVSKKIIAGTQPLRQCLLAARLIPLNKDDRGEGVRPIAVADVLYRICAKAVVQRAEMDLLPHQLGVKSANGVEPAIHLARFCGSTTAIAGFDLRNAFNSMRRSFIYTAVSKYSPQLLSTFVWAYEEHTNLFVGGRRALKSQSGVKQGDPLGPALFSLGFRLILEELIDRLEERGLQQEVPLLAYLDDLYVFGPPDKLPQVIDTVTTIFQGYESITGMVLRPEKTVTVVPEQFGARGLSLLGGHVGGGTDSFASKAVSSLSRQMTKLDSLHRQDAFILLTQCLQQKLTHLLRTLELPADFWKCADDLLLQKLTQWTQGFGTSSFVREIASLPIRLGGLGISLPSDLAVHAFPASVEESRFFLQSRFAAIDFYPADSPRPLRQRERVAPVRAAQLKSLQENLSPADKNTFLDLSSYLGRKVFTCLPLEARMQFRDLEWSAVLAEKLLFKKVRCIRCKIRTDVSHGHVCPANQAYRTHRHSAISRWVAEAVSSCGGSVTVEPQGQTPRHRADLLLDGQVIHGPVAVDFSVCDTLGAKAHRTRSKHKATLGTEEGILSVLTERETLKVDKYRGVDFGGTFVPLVMTTGGTLSAVFKDFISRFRTEATHAVGYRLELSLSCSLRKAAAQAIIASIYAKPKRN